MLNRSTNIATLALNTVEIAVTHDVNDGGRIWEIYGVIKSVKG